MSIIGRWLIVDDSSYYIVEGNFEARGYFVLMMSILNGDIFKEDLITYLSKDKQNFNFSSATANGIMIWANKSSAFLKKSCFLIKNFFFKKKFIFVWAEYFMPNLAVFFMKSFFSCSLSLWSYGILDVK